MRKFALLLAVVFSFFCVDGFAQKLAKSVAKGVSKSLKELVGREVSGYKFKGVKGDRIVEGNVPIGGRYGVVPYNLDSLLLRQNVTFNEIKKLEQQHNTLIKSFSVSNVKSQLAGAKQTGAQKFVIGLYDWQCENNSGGLYEWFDIGCKASDVGLDSIASDCYARCEQLAKEPRDVAYIIELYKNVSNDSYKNKLKSIVVNNIEDWFWDYDYMLQKSSSSGDFRLLSGGYVSDIDSALNISEGKYKPLVDVMKKGKLGVLFGVEDYVGALKKVVEDSLCYRKNTRELLIRRTIQTAVSSRNVSTIRQVLELYKSDQLQKYLEMDFVAAYSLFLASQMIYDEYAGRYYDICKSLDEERLVAQYQEHYQLVYDDFLKNPQNLALAYYLLAYNESQIELCNNLMVNLYEQMIGDVKENTVEYCAADKQPYKQAILYLAEVNDSLAGDNFTPIVAQNRLIHGFANAMFEESVCEGCEKIMGLYSQLKSMKDVDPDYLRLSLAIGANHANFIDLYLGRTKDAEKMIKETLPLIEKCDDVELVTSCIHELICFYERHGKSKNVSKMRKLLEKLERTVDAA